MIDLSRHADRASASTPPSRIYGRMAVEFLDRSRKGTEAGGKARAICNIPGGVFACYLLN